MRSKGTNDGMYVELLHTNCIRSEQTQNLHKKESYVMHRNTDPNM